MDELPKMPERSVELPVGCKDLIDVDATRNWTRVDHPDWPKRTLDQLAYMEGYLARLIESAGTAVLVCIGRFQNKGSIMVVAAPDLPGSVVFARWSNAGQEQALQGVFGESGISPLTEPVGRYKAKKSVKYPLPAEPSDAARLIGGLLRAAYGLSDLSPVTLFHVQPKTA
jgi:hypothetical protein